MKNKVLAICIKSYISEDDLDLFLEGELEILTQENVFRKGQTYLVFPQYYDKNYFKLID